MRALQSHFLFGFQNNFVLLLQSQHETKNAHKVSDGKAERMRPDVPDIPHQKQLQVRGTLIFCLPSLIPTKTLVSDQDLDRGLCLLQHGVISTRGIFPQQFVKQIKSSY